MLHQKNTSDGRLAGFESIFYSFKKYLLFFVTRKRPKIFFVFLQLPFVVAKKTFRSSCVSNGKSFRFYSIFREEKSTKFACDLNNSIRLRICHVNIHSLFINRRLNRSIKATKCTNNPFAKTLFVSIAMKHTGKNRSVTKLFITVNRFLSMWSVNFFANSMLFFLQMFTILYCFSVFFFMFLGCRVT